MPSTNPLSGFGLKILRAGIHSLLVDKGRAGFNRQGITQSGPSDPFAFNIANMLCGNHQGECAIELLVGDMELLAIKQVSLAITGAETTVLIDGQSSDMWQSITLKRGQKLSIANANKGLRVYVAVAGGFDVKSSYGSCTTVVREGLGGLQQNGQVLEKGDLLPCKASQDCQSVRLASRFVPDYLDHLVLRFIPSYQFKQFRSLQVRRFLTSQFVVSNDLDRMGVRLKGKSIEVSQIRFYSEGIVLGAIQIPADGQPIVMMVDHQTIGGYPKIGTVLSLDCARLAQAKPGTSIRFEAIDMMTAHNLLHLDAVNINSIRSQLI